MRRTVWKWKGSRRTVYRRFLFTMAVLLGIVLGVHSLTNSMQPDQFIEVTVTEGDTLWDIAKRFNQHQDPRKVIYSIKKINRLDSGFIIAGQIIRVPLYH